MPNIGLYTKETYPTDCNNTPIKVTVGKGGYIELLYSESGKPKSIKVTEGTWILDAMYSKKFTVNNVPDPGMTWVQGTIRAFRANEVLENGLVFNYQKQTIKPATSNVDPFDRKDVPKTPLERLDALLPLLESVVERGNAYLESIGW